MVAMAITGGGAGDTGARRAVDLVACSDPGAGAGLDHDLVAGMDVFADRAGRQPDAIFMHFDLFRHTDAHRTNLQAVSGVIKPRKADTL